MEFFQSSVNLSEVFVQLLAFVIVFWTLKLLAWKPILKGIEARREQIENEFKKIELLKAEAESLRVDYLNRIQKIEEHSRQKLQEAMDEGRRVGREVQEQARHEARLVLEKAKDDIALEVAKAKVMLRNEIADLTLAATGRILNEKLNETKDKEMVLDFIEGLEKLK